MPARRSRKWQRQKDSHFTTSYPRAGRCPICRRNVLCGYDGGLFQTYDFHLLSQRGEVEALVRGLRTYHAQHPHFTRRTVSLIQNYPVPRIGFIVRQHRCDTPEPKPEALQPDQDRELPDLPDF